LTERRRLRQSLLAGDFSPISHRSSPKVSSLPFRSIPLFASALLLTVLTGCSSVGDFFSGDRVDYRSSARRTDALEVPPDLTQLSREGRYRPQGTGPISASAYTAQPAAAATAAVAPQAVGDLRVERDGNQRWLVTPMTPEQLWPQLQAFWQENGFAIAVNAPEAGVMETDWLENRAKLPQDIVRRTLGRVLDTFYSTGERDMFRTRVERVGGNTEIFVSHRGMEEVYTTTEGSRAKEETRWQPRPPDPQLEAEMLSRLMVKLGKKPEEAQAAVEAAPPAAPRARLLSGGSAAALQVDEPFDRAWRRVGLSLDRSGFTVEDRDRAGGLYFVRYADPAQAQKEEPGFFARLFRRGGEPKAPDRYRVALTGEAERTRVAVLDAKGDPSNDAVAKRIVSLLVEDLK
jgi:outer membrane protein assembly factor BamC